MFKVNFTMKNSKQAVEWCGGRDFSTNLLVNRRGKRVFSAITELTVESTRFFQRALWAPHRRSKTGDGIQARIY